MRRIGALAAAALHVARDPVLLEPADVAEGPERRIELGGERRREVGRQDERLAVVGGLRGRGPAQGLVAGLDQGQREQLLAGACAGARRRGRGRRSSITARACLRPAPPPGRRAAVERQVARRHVGLVEALATHLVGRRGVAADPGHRHDRRVLDDAGPQRSAPCPDRDVGVVAEGDLDRARLDRHRADVVVDDLVGDRQARRRRCRAAACRSRAQAAAIGGLTMSASLIDSTMRSRISLSEMPGNGEQGEDRDDARSRSSSRASVKPLARRGAAQRR